MRSSELLLLHDIFYLNSEFFAASEIFLNIFSLVLHNYNIFYTGFFCCVDYVLENWLCRNREHWLGLCACQRKHSGPDAGSEYNSLHSRHFKWRNIYYALLQLESEGLWVRKNNMYYGLCILTRIQRLLKAGILRKPISSMSSGR